MSEHAHDDTLDQLPADAFGGTRGMDPPMAGVGLDELPKNSTLVDHASNAVGWLYDRTQDIGGALFRSPLGAVKETMEKKRYEQVWKQYAPTPDQVRAARLSRDPNAQLRLYEEAKRKTEQAMANAHYAD